MITRKAYTVTYEHPHERVREEVTTYRFLGIPLYHDRVEVWRRAGTVDDDTRAIVFAVDDWQCVYCGETDEKLMTIDHRIPQNQGGTSAFANLLTACKSCNSAKQDKTPEEARLSLTFGRFQELPESSEQMIQIMAADHQLGHGEIGGYSFYYLIGEYFQRKDRRWLQQEGILRRAVIGGTRHIVIRRNGWDLLWRIHNDERIKWLERERWLHLEESLWIIKENQLAIEARDISENVRSAYQESINYMTARLQDGGIDVAGELAQMPNTPPMRLVARWAEWASPQEPEAPAPSRWQRIVTALQAVLQDDH